MTALYPYLFCIAAVFGYSALTPLAKRLGQEIPPHAFVAISALFLSLFAFLGSNIFEKAFSFKFLTLNQAGGFLVFSAINYLAFIFMLIGIKSVAAVEYQIIWLLSPLFVAGMAYFLLNEPLYIRQLVGFIIVSIGIFISIHGFGK